MIKRMQGASPMLMALGGFVVLGALLVGLTVWILLLVYQPTQPEQTEDVKPPVNNTPYVGKQW